MAEPGALPILYSFRRCPFAMRARMAIRSSGQICELREVLLRDKPIEMIDASSKATVPVVVLPDGGILDESLAIMNWALAQADPDDLLSENDAEQLLSLIDGPFKHHLDRYKYASRYEDIDPKHHRAAAVEILHQIEAQLAGQDWLYGNDPTFADLAILPFVRQFRIADEKWFDTEIAMPNLQAWLTRFLAAEFFQAVMAKHQPWQPGDQPVYFPS